MKHAKKLLSLLVPILMATSLTSCVVDVTCISHIDKDLNGQCDNCKQKVAIPEKSNVDSIVVKTVPTKTYFAMGEELDTTGGVLTINYNDGTPSKDIPFSEEGVKIYSPNMNSKGNASVSIAYKGAKTKYAIEIGDARFKVSFDLGYIGAPAIADQVVTIKNVASKPADPIREGYDFVGWYTDNTLSKNYDFEAVEIMQDTVVFAKWMKKYTVTYSANYQGGASITQQTVNGKVSADVVPAARNGYHFAGWCSDEQATKPFSFDTVITQDTKIYASWVAESVTMYTVTFNENYGASPKTSTSKVADGQLVGVPAAPSRAGSSTKGHKITDVSFVGWYLEAECKNAYNFSTPVTKDITLYAKWSATYTFEAEHVDFVDDFGEPIKGMGASGGSEGPNMIDSPPDAQIGINASNGYYVTYLFAYGIALNFVIESDRDVQDATLIFRITCETMPFGLDPSVGEDESEPVFNGSGELEYYVSNYTVSCNGEPIMYERIVLEDAQGHEDTGGRRPFSNHVLTTTLNLKKGQNIIRCETTNHQGLGGTMSATAPVIDCIMINTSAVLDWNPLVDNEFGQ